MAAGIFMSMQAGMANAGRLDPNQLDEFVRSMADTYDFDRRELNRLFAGVNYSQSVIDAISRPAERLPWYRYKQIFLTEDRVQAGVKYWRQHADTLAQAEADFGVPAEIIVAIIGVETRYGTHKGRHRVLDSLTTLAFDYPPRSGFFRSELEQYLILTREQGLDPLQIHGSYAGAMGIPQFISSSYRNYAIDYSGNGQVNLLDDHTDAIGSVANYFKRHGWVAGEPVIFPVKGTSGGTDNFITSGLKPEHSYAEIRQAGFEVDADIDDNAGVKIFEFEEQDGKRLWLAMNNFYVITRYNHSSLYALAVYLLAQDIREQSGF